MQNMHDRLRIIKIDATAAAEPDETFASVSVDAPGFGPSSCTG